MKEINGKMKLTEEEISGYIDEANDILKMRMFRILSFLLRHY